VTKPMTEDDFMIASPADRKAPAVLLAGQGEITIEIDDDGGVILRQADQLGGDPDQIVVVAANLSAFLEALIDITPHGRGWYDLGGMPPDWSAEPNALRDAAGAVAGAFTSRADQSSPSARRTPAAERQRRCRERKRAAATGGPSPLPL
jgi:hypothetical protein